ncbi:MAG: pilus assembly protein [Pseudomonadota bacterium]|jgi:Flp pilus assembly protein TadG|nr:pilus assembly protein [Pseudooceanicola nitratireducens]MEC7794825.1 pilus assembly protein [Pseudomonadota bacterium]MEC8668439.1 pilus assembly protein [Pseudomonadota bacterium]
MSAEMTRFRPRPFALLRARLSAFADDSRGSVAVESIVLLPLVIWTYVAMFTFFDMLRMKSVNQKAAFTLADAYSRETEKINDTYVDSTFTLFQALTRVSSPGMRVSVISYDADTDKYTVRWSQIRGSGVASRLDDNNVNTLRTQLPGIVDGDEFILLETWNDYKVPFKIGLGDFKMKGHVFMNPRFADQLKWDDGTPS